MKNKLSRFLTVVLVFAGLTSIKAQTDTEFWFAAPEVSVTHGDNPILFSNECSKPSCQCIN